GGGCHYWRRLQQDHRFVGRRHHHAARGVHRRWRGRFHQSVPGFAVARRLYGRTHLRSTHHRRRGSVVVGQLPHHLHQLPVTCVCRVLPGQGGEQGATLLRAREGR